MSVKQTEYYRRVIGFLEEQEGASSIRIEPSPGRRTRPRLRFDWHGRPREFSVRHNSTDWRAPLAMISFLKKELGIREVAAQHRTLEAMVEELSTSTAVPICDIETQEPPADPPQLNSESPAAAAVNDEMPPGLSVARYRQYNHTYLIFNMTPEFWAVLGWQITDMVRIDPMGDDDSSWHIYRDRIGLRPTVHQSPTLFGFRGPPEDFDLTVFGKSPARVHREGDGILVEVRDKIRKRQSRADMHPVDKDAAERRETMATEARLALAAANIPVSAPMPTDAQRTPPSMPVEDPPIDHRPTSGDMKASLETIRWIESTTDFRLSNVDGHWRYEAKIE